VSGFPPPPPPPPAGYEPPPGAHGGVGGPHETAGFWIRFAAALVDSLIIAVPLAVVTNGLDLGLYADQSLNILIGALYYPLQEGGLTGQTIGKRLCGIRVVDESEGHTVDVSRALVRYLVSLVSGFVCLLGYLWMLWDPRRQTWHDKVSRTLVVRV
jgi:uncharacterized RDD family membrane protein YckC